MNDPINREDAINAIYHHFPQMTMRECADVLHEVPSAQPEQPEIIRCKDCKQFRRWVDTNTLFCDITESEMSYNDFCSRAERRTNVRSDKP